MAEMSVAEPVSSTSVARQWLSRQLPWRYGRHVLDGGLALADQAMVSGTNFLTSVLLARWLAPAEYGLYALMLSFVYLLASVQQALVIQPMRVFGGTIYKAEQRDYFGNLVLGSVGIGLAMAAVFSIVGLIWRWFGDGDAPQALIGAGLAVFGVMLFWLGRNASYITSGPKAASVCDAVYVVITLT
ncbi:MAG TPA: hypothetical protein ENJ62_06175, partial [Bryobacterales bacterium]|nr:hypothetical protein [Bryobacterales bacterium]